MTRRKGRKAFKRQMKQNGMIKNASGDANETIWKNL